MNRLLFYFDIQRMDDSIIVHYRFSFMVYKNGTIHVVQTKLIGHTRIIAGIIGVSLYASDKYRKRNIDKAICSSL